jgi:hypothetical protein
MNISTANPIRSHTFTMLVFVIQSSMPGPRRILQYRRHDVVIE